MLEFNQEKHEYTLDGKVLISVTQLMRKHGLSPDYSFVAEDVLKAKAERGTLIHAELEAYIKNGEVGFTGELNQFIAYAQKNKLEFLASEKMLHNDICAGTCDLLFKQDGKIIRADFKTTSAIHRDPCSWQLSIYDELDDVKADALQIFHFDNDGVLRVVDIDFKPNEYVKDLFEVERKGIELYHIPTISIDAETLAIVKSAQEIIAKADAMKKEAEANMDKVKNAIIEAMEKSGIKSFDSDFVKITYVDPVEKTTIDSARLKKEQPDIAMEYSKKSMSKASIRITLKGGKDE